MNHSLITVWLLAPRGYIASHECLSLPPGSSFGCHRQMVRPGSVEINSDCPGAVQAEVL